MAPHTIHMQAVNYAAMVSRLTPDDVAEMYAAHQTSRGHQMDSSSALTELTTLKLVTPKTVRRPRIVLVASDFSASVTNSVVWLREQGVDISSAADITKLAVGQQRVNRAGFIGQ